MTTPVSELVEQTEQAEQTKHAATIRLLLVDSHAISRTSSRMLLDSFPTLHVLGETSDYMEALTMVSVMQPDVVLISMRVQGATGPEAAKQILKLRPATKLIFLTLFDDPEYVRAALDAGAHAYVLKQEPAAEVLQAIDRVMRGETYLSPGLNRKN
jgi:DNA-binding NarL/FixJ family response regulator